MALPALDAPRGVDAPRPDALTFGFLRDQTVGVDTPVQTPFGERLLVYADYTASGRQLAFIEDYLRTVAARYANSHTEDSLTGRTTTRLLHDAEATIKAAVHAGPEGRLVACGTGSTGAIDRFQHLVGVALPPVTRRRLGELMRDALGADAACALETEIAAHCPVVFVGPYEHHSNEVTWREGFCEVVEVGLAPDGGLDLDHLDALLADPAWADRPRIGSFSAASNVTGMRTPVHEVARRLHRAGAMACFDYAASAPYETIDMNPAGDDEGALDAVFLSPHKFLGGPGACGVLVFNERVYRSDLAPSVGGGGTVVYVNEEEHAFIAGTEEREQAGTPGVFQTLRAALALEVQGALGTDCIEAREQALLGRALRQWKGNPGLEILGNPDPARRIGIVSFNVRDPQGRYLHPRLVTTLLDDLFGIQSRAGCSCAGPYAHRLLGIEPARARQLLAFSRDGYHGLKPGWCRVGFHFTMDEAEADFLIEAVDFVGRHGHRFLPLYRFRVRSGTWAHEAGRAEPAPLSLNAALAARPVTQASLPAAERSARYAAYLREAEAWAERLLESSPACALDGELAALQYFAVAEGTLVDEDPDDAFCGGF